MAVTNAEYIPTWVLISEADNKTNFILLPMSKYLNSSENALPDEILDNMKKAWDHTIALLGETAK